MGGSGGRASWIGLKRTFKSHARHRFLEKKTDRNFLKIPGARPSAPSQSATPPCLWFKMRAQVMGEGQIRWPAQRPVACIMADAQIMLISWVVAYRTVGRRSNMRFILSMAVIITALGAPTR